MVAIYIYVIVYTVGRAAQMVHRWCAVIDGPGVSVYTPTKPLRIPRQKKTWYFGEYVKR